MNVFGFAFWWFLFFNFLVLCVAGFLFRLRLRFASGLSAMEKAAKESEAQMEIGPNQLRGGGNDFRIRHPEIFERFERGKIPRGRGKFGQTWPK